MPSIALTSGLEMSVANIFCVGRNYTAHAKELGNAVEAEPVVFLKPTSALLREGSPIVLPEFSADVHHEIELVVLIGRNGKRVDRAAALSYVAGYGLGLDLTARDIQNVAKAKGLPWTLGKGFEGSACVSTFVPAPALPDPVDARFTLDVNGKRRQSGDARNMVFDIPFLISYLSHRFGLQAGDLIFTGTPEGVAALHSGDHLALRMGELIAADFHVA